MPDRVKQRWDKLQGRFRTKPYTTFFKTTQNINFGLKPLFINTSFKPLSISLVIPEAFQLILQLFNSHSLYLYGFTDHIALHHRRVMQMTARCSLSRILGFMHCKTDFKIRFQLHTLRTASSSPCRLEESGKRSAFCLHANLDLATANPFLHLRK